MYTLVYIKLTNFVADVSFTDGRENYGNFLLSVNGSQADRQTDRQPTFSTCFVFVSEGSY